MRGDAAARPKADLADPARQDQLRLCEVGRETLGHRRRTAERWSVTIRILAVGTANALTDADRLDIPSAAQIKPGGCPAALDPGAIDVGTAQ